MMRSPQPAMPLAAPGTAVGTAAAASTPEQAPAILNGSAAQEVSASNGGGTVISMIDYIRIRGLSPEVRHMLWYTSMWWAAGRLGHEWAALHAKAARLPMLTPSNADGAHLLPHTQVVASGALSRHPELLEALDREVSSKWVRLLLVDQAIACALPKLNIALDTMHSVCSVLEAVAQVMVCARPSSL